MEGSQDAAEFSEESERSLKSRYVLQKFIVLQLIANESSFSSRNCATYLSFSRSICLCNSQLNFFTIRYNYLCGTIRYPTTPIKKINGRTYNGDGDMLYLDRQFVKCPSNSVISQVGLKRSGDDSWYEYVCSRLTYGRQHCTVHTTPFSYDGDGDTVYLDRQHVMCPHGNTLSSFRLERSGDHDHVPYRITCCRTIR